MNCNLWLYISLSVSKTRQIKPPEWIASSSQLVSESPPCGKSAVVRHQIQRHTRPWTGRISLMIKHFDVEGWFWTLFIIRVRSTWGPLESGWQCGSGSESPEQLELSFFIYCQYLFLSFIVILTVSRNSLLSAHSPIFFIGTGGGGGGEGGGSVRRHPSYVFAPALLKIFLLAGLSISGYLVE